MRIERTKNAAKGITAGLLLRILQTVLPILMRTAMIRLMGVEYLGLNGLFTSILHILNLAELGVGAAMVFSMYRPIAEDDETTICALMRLYRRYYRLIGLVVGAMGLALMPVLPKLISGEIPPELDIYVLYLLNLGSTVLTYWLFAYKNCLLQAHQRTDVASLITMLTSLVQTVLQFAVLFLTRNYYWYVIVAMATQALNNVCTAAVATKMYPRYRPEGKLSRAQTRAINGRIRDLFTGKLGSVVLSSSDTVVISAFLGLAVLAVYQNYFFIVTSVISVIEIMLQSVMAGLGNSFITEVKEKNYRDFRKFTFIYLWLVGVCTCCFLGLYQPFMKIWVGEELMLGFSAVICFAVYFFLCALNRLLNIYKDAAGLAAVFGVAAVIPPGSAGHDDADRVVAGSLAENAHQRAVLAAGIAEDNAFQAGAVHKVPNPGNAAVVFLLPVSGDHGFPSFCFSTLSNTPGSRKSQDFSAPDCRLLQLRGSEAELSPADFRAAHICLG